LQSQHHHPLSRLLARLQTRVELDGKDQAAVLALPHTLRSIKAGQYLVRDGEKVTHCCLVVSGFAIRHKIVADGGRQIIAVHMAGDMVDLQNSLLHTADHNVQALDDIEVALIPREALEDLAFSNRALGKAMWLETLVGGAVFREWIVNVGRRDARQRIAHLLCEFALRLEAAGLGETCNYTLPMTQEQLADAVGLTPVHVNRTLQALDAEGLTRRTKRAVIIDDWKKLTEAGDFDPLYLHMPEARALLA
jgi:CRP-like cAMP-binding protein